jgi:CSLREA domain-containing protein
MRRFAFGFALIGLCSPLMAATMVVNSVLDTVNPGDGECTLREAILVLNSGVPDTECYALATVTNPFGTNDTIRFAITFGGSTKTIVLGSALPSITVPMLIDGYTQPGASANTQAPNAFPNALGLDSQIRIEIDGSNVPAGNYGLRLASNGSHVRGLALFNFSGTSAAIRVAGSNNIIAGNFIGLRANGTTVGANNGNYGVQLSQSNNTVGGSQAARRNLIAGHQLADAYIDATGGNTIAGNVIGTDISGTLARGSGTGVYIKAGPGAASGNAITNNLIAGIVGQGIFLDSAALTTVSGNTVGIAAGGGALGNWLGIQITNNVSGISGTGNNISGNGIAYSTGLPGNPASGDGILVRAPGGIIIPDPVGQRMDANTIWGNAGLGINLAPIVGGGFQEGDGLVTANDAPAALDADTGPNRLQNFPVIASAMVNGANVDIVFTLDSAANGNYAISAYANDTCDPSGHGEGQFPASGTPGYATNASGHLATTLSVPLATMGWAVGKWVTLLATDSASNETSEFSTCMQITAASGTPVATPSPASVNFGNQTVATSSAPQTVTVTNNGTVNLVVGAGGVSLTGANAGDFSITGDSCGGATVAPAGTCTVSLRFSPAALGARAANLAIASNAPASPLAIALSGSGTVAAPAEVAAVPTLSKWGLVLLGLLFASIVPFAIRKETP